MTRTRVVILSSRSLFVEGIASRLRQHLDEQEIRSVDASRADALAQVVGLQPSTVILDATDEEATRHCPLSALVNALALLTIIRLDPQREKIQVVTSQQRSVGEVRDLIEVIKRAG